MCLCKLLIPSLFCRLKINQRAQENYESILENSVVTDKSNFALNEL
jgi:hypothetical protein